MWNRRIEGGEGEGTKCGLYLYYYLRGFFCLGSSFFWLKNALTPLCLCRDKTEGQSGKNITLIPTKILPKKYGQITLSIYKLNSQNMQWNASVLKQSNKMHLFWNLVLIESSFV